MVDFCLNYPTWIGVAILVGVIITIAYCSLLLVNLALEFIMWAGWKIQGGK